MSLYAIKKMYEITLNINSLYDDEIEMLLNELAYDDALTNKEYIEIYENVMMVYKLSLGQNF